MPPVSATFHYPKKTYAQSGSGLQSNEYICRRVFSNLKTNADREESKWNLNPRTSENMQALEKLKILQEQFSIQNQFRLFNMQILKLPKLYPNLYPFQHNTHNTMIIQSRMGSF